MSSARVPVPLRAAAATVAAVLLAACATGPDTSPDGDLAAAPDAEVTTAEPATELDLPGLSGGVATGDDGAAGDDADAGEDRGGASGGAVHRVDAVDADGSAFTPADRAIAVGDTVVWRMAGDVAHTVTGGGLVSGILDPGEEFEATFDEAGEVAYFCYLHAGMTGTITVG